MHISIAKVKLKKQYLLAFSYLLSGFITVLVYLTGGTNKVYPNLMYIPITIAASTSGKRHGLLHGVISGLLLGPFMPLDVALNTPQDPLNWIVRVITYLMVALVIGFFSDYYRRELERNIKRDKEIFEAQMATIYSLVKLAESRDDDTGAHIERVVIFTRLLAENLRKRPNFQKQITEDYIDKLSKASSLRDVGKVAIPDSILLKPGKLTPEEFAIMKTHTVKGANTLLGVWKKYPDNKFLELGISIARHHHERWNGTGYPDGLAGEEIPLAARIMTLVDVYDAVRSKRVYKEPIPHKEAVEIIKEGRGTIFDPEIVDVFMGIEDQFEKTYEKYSTKAPEQES